MLQQETYYDLCTEINQEFHPHAEGWATIAEAKKALARHCRYRSSEKAFIIQITWTRVSNKEDAEPKLEAV